MKYVGSITTLPNRLNELNKTIKSILRQSDPLDKLYINIPLKTLKNKTYKILPNFLEQFDGFYTKVIIHRCVKDYGPITKLAPILDVETDNGTYIFTFDDDMLFHRDAIKILKQKIKQYPNTCLCFSGVCTGSFPFYYQIVSDNKDDCKVDWIEGVHICVYCRNFFINTEELIKFGKNFPIHRYLLYNDDHKISGYLANKNIPRVSIGKNCTDYIFKSSASQENSLSSRTITLWVEHYFIIKYFKDIGLYREHYNITKSLVFHALFLIIVIILICTNFLKKYMIIYILILILYIKINIIDKIDQKMF